MSWKILSLMLCMIVLLFATVVAFAATDVYDLICTRSSDGQSLRLYTSTMKFNQDSLAGDMWADQADNAARNWDFFGSPLTDDEVTYSNADIIFKDGQTIYTWVAAECRSYDEDGNQFSSNPSTWSSYGYDFETHYAIITADLDWGQQLGSTDRESILTHELGHAIGLGHPCSSGIVSIMQGDTSNSGARSSVTSGDKDAIKQLY